MDSIDILCEATAARKEKRKDQASHLNNGCIEALHMLMRPGVKDVVEKWMRTAGEDQKRGIIRLARKANKHSLSHVTALQKQLPSLLRRGMEIPAGAGLPYEVDRLDERRELFLACDPNGNGLCSFAEIDAIFRLRYGFGEEDKMQILHAFNACSNIGGQETGPAADYIEHKEFRKFLESVHTYLGGEVDRARCQTNGHAMLGNQVQVKTKAQSAPVKKPSDLPFQPNRQEERDKLFKQCDPNGNRFASFAEIDAIFRKKYGFGEDEKMPMLRAYDSCKNFGGDETGNAAEYIEHKEFRKFLELVDKNLNHARIQSINLCGGGTGLGKSASSPSLRRG